MALQYDLFDYENNKKDEILYQLEKLQADIANMRRSFFVRLDAQEKKYIQLLENLNNGKEKLR